MNLFHKESQMRYSLIILFLASLTDSFGQVNLVPNHNFYEFTKCPEQASDLFSVNWKNPANHPGSADFFHECSTGPFGVPYAFGDSLFGQDSNSYAGIITYIYQDGFDFNAREYIQAELSNTLINQQLYKVGFHVKPYDSNCVFTNNISAAISSTPLTGNGQSEPLNFSPQISSTSNVILNDTKQWTYVSQLYQANGGEKFITIGNFDMDSVVQKMIKQCVHNGAQAYYFIDNVTVFEHGTLEIHTNRDSICYGETVVLKNNQNVEGYWFDSIYPTTILGNGSTFSFSPDSTLTIGFNDGTESAFYNLFVVRPQFSIETELVINCETKEVTISTVEMEAWSICFPSINGCSQSAKLSSDSIMINIFMANCKFTESIAPTSSNCPKKLQMPNVFSPNGDGTNDFFLPIEIPDNLETQIYVLNRWGQVIYNSSAKLFKWDGNYNENPCPDGLYYWKGITENQSTDIGFFHLIRN